MKLTTVLFFYTLLLGLAGRVSATEDLTGLVFGKNNQENTAESNKDDRFNYFRVFFNTPLQGVQFYQGEDASSAAIKFRPNSAVQTEFTFGHKGLYAGFSLKGEEKAPERGKTTYTQYRLGFNLYKFAVFSYYQSYKGFHLESPKKDNDEFFYFPSFESRNYGLNTAYFFSKDHIRGADTVEFHKLMADTKEPFLKSASWVAKIGYDFNELKNAPQDDTELLEKPESDYIEMTGGEFQTIYMVWGLDFYYIISNFFIDFQFAIGPGYQIQKFYSRGEEVNSNDTSSVTNVRINLGFHVAKMIIAIKAESLRIESDLQFNRGYSSNGENAGLFISKIF